MVKFNQTRAKSSRKMRIKPQKESTERVGSCKLSIVIIHLTVYLFLLTFNTTKCLKVDTASLEKSGWRVVDTWPPTIPSQRRQSTRDLNPREPYIFESAKSNGSTKGKLIEWDDDDAHNEHHQLERTRLPRNQSGASIPSSTITSLVDKFSEDSLRSNAMNSLLEDRLKRPPIRPQTNLDWWPGGSIKQTKNPRLNRLIFHGQVKNDSKRIIDGLEYFIDTHKPVSINRSPQFRSNHKRPLESERVDEVISKDEEDVQDPTTTVLPAFMTTRALKGSRTFTQSPPIKGVTYEKVKGKRHEESKHKSMFSPEIGSSSDWRPITLISRARRSGKSALDKLQSKHEERSLKSNGSVIKLDYSWKPLKTKSSSSMLLITTTTSTTTNKPKDMDWFSTTAATPQQKTTVNNKQNVIYGKKTILSPHRYEPSPVSLEGPFEDDGIITMARGDNDDRDLKAEDQFDESQVESEHNSRRSIKREGDQKDSSKQSDRGESNKWTPVETTTAPPMETTTMSPPLTTTLVSNSGPLGNTNSSEQRSASDLNYIYSSQPVLTQQQTQPAPASSSYYSNYLIQPSPVQQISPPTNEPQPNAPIIDTVSGQTPEMIDRDNPPVSNPTDYSTLQQTVPMFQTQQQPLRQPVASQYPYDYSSFVPQRAQAQQVRQPAATTPSAQVVRQEHHYHYYNNNNNQQPQQQRDQSDQRQQSTITNSQAPQSHTIMRELQPLVLSQPIIQQITPPSTTSTTTTTPAPQIIREIVRELPAFAQIPNIQRLLIPQVPAIPVPLALPAPPPVPLVQREAAPTFDPASLVSAYAPARIMRQISNSIPSVSIRVPQFKLTQQAPTPVAIPLRATVPILPVASAAATIRGLSPVTRHAGSYVIPSLPKQTTTYLTETQAMPSHTTIMQTTQYTPASRTTVFTTDHQPAPQTLAASTSAAYAKSRK